MFNVIKPCQKPELTIFVPFTRQWVLGMFFDCLEALEVPRKETELVFYVDTQELGVYSRVNNWSLLNQSDWNGILIVKSGNPAPEVYSPIPRRDRIVQLKEKSKEWLSGKYIMGLEDDTEFPPDAYIKLKKMMTKYPKAGFVQGVQVGRWGLNVLGAWKADDIHNPTKYGTVPFEENKIVPIDGGGFFCYLTTKELYLDHKYYWEFECFGPDSTFGLELRRKGLECYMDTSIVCPHHTEQGVLRPSKDTVTTVEWHKEGTRWVRPQLTI